MSDLEALAARAKVDLFDYQSDYLQEAVGLKDRQRVCLYYRTGAGKTMTALLSMALWGHEEVLVIAPPATHSQWQVEAQRLGMRVHMMSHAKFRGRMLKVSRTMPIIADEFHLFGGQKGMGWRKLDRVARSLEAPLILMSATPNYNDAERVYCVQHILSPHATKGGYLQFLYENCTTEQDPFSMTPKVTGFKDYPDAAAFLADLPRVFHLPDERVIHIQDIEFDPALPPELDQWGYDEREHRMIASPIEAMHVKKVQGLLDGEGYIKPAPWGEIFEIASVSETLLIFSVHTSVAIGVAASLARAGLESTVVLGSSGHDQKLLSIDRFRRGETRILIGTATLATGTDGLDKVCDTLLIVDDTDDEAMRRQLIGRILPRGVYAPIDDKRVFRLVPA